MRNLQPTRLGKPKPELVMLDLCNQAQAELYLSSKHMGRPDFNSKPGDFILKQPNEVRDVLKNLKSEDMFKLRYENWEIVGVDNV